MTDAELKLLVLDVLGRIAPETNPAELEGGADMREALDLDSMDFMNFVIELTQRLHVDIAESEYRRFYTLDGCLRELRARLAPH